ncbi:MAG: GNAT family N-acetyltransferase [Candidatus Spyradocola sp.]
MGVVRSHAHVLRDNRIVLRPLTDADLPALYRWNADPEVLYWTEGDENPEPMTPEDVDGMYAAISRNALCFAIEVDGAMIDVGRADSAWRALRDALAADKRGIQAPFSLRGGRCCFYKYKMTKNLSAWF